MTSSSDTNSDLVRTTQPGHKVKDAIINLTQYFNIETIPECERAEGERYDKVECEHDKSKALKDTLNKVREKFKEEFKEVSTGLLYKRHLLTRACTSRLLALLEQCSTVPARNTTYRSQPHY